MDAEDMKNICIFLVTFYLIVIIYMQMHNDRPCWILLQLFSKTEMQRKVFSFI